MLPPEPTSPKSPKVQAPADEPRSRKPARASNAATPPDSAVFSSAPPQINIEWSDIAINTLKSHIFQRGLKQELRDEAIVAQSNGAKRACNLIVRQTIRRVLCEAKPLYPALQTQLENLDNPQWRLDISFTDDATMREINRDHRGKDKATDVLSFPVWEGETFPMPPDESEIMLGDMVISIETAIGQAGELNHDLRAEIAFLAAHGTLHLLGYDHGTDGERRKMFALQDQIVAQLREDKGF